MYRVLVNEKIGKRVAKFPEAEQRKIKKVLDSLRETPLPQGKDLRKLKSTKFPLWRIRVGDLRVIYSFSSEDKVIKVVKIDFRGRVY